MKHMISATEARIRFGELMRQAVETQEPIVVERGGKPHVVVLSIATYERLQATHGDDRWRAGLERAIQVGARIRARRSDRPLTPPEEIVHRAREERDAGLAHLR